MIHFVICTKDGRIDQAGIYDEELLHTLDIPEGGDLVVNQSMPAGDLFYFSKGAFHAIPEKPAGHYSFDYSKKAWVDPRTLDDIKLAKWEIIKQARSSAEFGGFTWDGSPFDSDAISQSRIQGALQLAAMVPGFTVDWTLANNSARNLNAADLANVGAALGMHVAAQHAKARLLRSQIEAATTVAEVDAVTW